jgi:hypothetical protein
LLQTVWLQVRRDHNKSTTSLSENESESSDYSDESEGDPEESGEVNGEIVLDERSQRLVDWTVDQLARLLKQILARRKLLGIEVSEDVAKMQMLDFSEGGTVIDEVKDIMDLVPFDPEAGNLESMADVMTLPPEVMTQLRDFVATIATLHNDNQFHNYSHVRPLLALFVYLNHVFSLSNETTLLLIPGNACYNERGEVAVENCFDG